MGLCVPVMQLKCVQMRRYLCYSLDAECAPVSLLCTWYCVQIPWSPCYSPVVRPCIPSMHLILCSNTQVSLLFFCCAPLIFVNVWMCPCIPAIHLILCICAPVSLPYAARYCVYVPLYPCYTPDIVWMYPCIPAIHLILCVCPCIPCYTPDIVCMCPCIPAIHLILCVCAPVSLLYRV
jgi:hypothetical protein